MMNEKESAYVEIIVSGVVVNKGNRTVYNIGVSDDMNYYIGEIKIDGSMLPVEQMNAGDTWLLLAEVV